MITENEKDIARHCISYTMASGASGVRVSLNKNTQDSCTYLNGKIDKVTHSADRSVFLTIFADDRFGTFSTNRLDRNELEDFITKALEMTRMLGPDPCRKLPDYSRTAKDAFLGTELDLYDEDAAGSEASERMKAAGSMCIYGKTAPSDDYEIISEECEYAESAEDTLLIDSNGFEGRHKETTFSVFAEITVSDRSGNKYSGHWWDSSLKYNGPDNSRCASKALENAVRQIGPKKRRSGRYRMIVDRNVASRLVGPIINALNAQAIQQKVSFLGDSLGKKVFSEGFTLIDLARQAGKPGARLFDYEGVATEDRTIIREGTVSTLFVSTYTSGKTGLAPTIDGISHPVMCPYMKGQILDKDKKDVSLEDILEFCRNGIYVTGFNGGNCSPVTGDFSFGIEGFAVRNGRILHPVKEMLITGNIIQLWNGLLAVGSDGRECSRWQIPSLAFEGVSFSG